LRHLGQADRLKTSFGATCVSFKKTKKKKEKKKTKIAMAGTSNLPTNKFCDFAGF